MRSIILCALVGLGPTALPAQIEYTRPDDVAIALLRADSLGDWRAVLRLGHPDAIADFRRGELERLRGDWLNEMGSGSVRACMSRHLARQIREALDSTYRVATVDALARLPADTVFARYHAWKAQFRPPPDVDSSFTRPLRTYLGHVLANDSTAYGVLIESWPRHPVPGWPATEPKIMTLRRYGTGWRSMLDPEMSRGVSVMLMTSGDDDC